MNSELKRRDCDLFEMPFPHSHLKEQMQILKYIRLSTTWPGIKRVNSRTVRRFKASDNCRLGFSVHGPCPYRLQKKALVAGERYDVVLEATNNEKPYWILVQGLATCADKRIYQLGVLQYGNTTPELRALPDDPGYDGFPRPANYRVSFSNAHAQTLSTMQTLPRW
jgi:hypothetical protein